MYYVVECASDMRLDQLTRHDNGGCYRLLLHRGEQWRPVGELEAAQSECHAVANYCDVTALVADKATKDAFLQELRTATVLHIGAIDKRSSLKCRLLCFNLKIRSRYRTLCQRLMKLHMFEVILIHV